MKNKDGFRKPLYVRLYIYLAVFLFVVVLVSVTVIFAPFYFLTYLFFLPKNVRDGIGYLALNICAFFLHSFLLLRYDFKGDEIIKKIKESKEKSICLIANHTSTLDISILLFHLRALKIGFVAKNSLFKIPVFNFYLFLTESISIDREDIRSGLEAIKKGREKIKNGKAILIFPEGTRSKTGKVAEFKRGAFKLAEGVSSCVIPIAIKGARSYFETRKRIFVKKRAEFRIFEPLSFVGLSKDDILKEEALIESEIRQEAES